MLFQHLDNVVIQMISLAILTDPSLLLVILDLIIFSQEKELVAAVQEEFGRSCYCFIRVRVSFRLKKRLQQAEQSFNG